MSSWKALYDSGWHHPGMAWALCAVALVVTVRRVPAGGLRTALLVFTGTTALDAWMTGALSPLPPALGQSVSIAFVVLGDLRLFALVEQHRCASSWTKALLRALPLSFVVPVAQALALEASPSTFGELRHVFLVYELLFVVLASALLLLRYPSRRARSPALGWYATSLVGFFLVQYGLWVAADVLILAGVESGYGLRLVPNALYYGLFLAFAAWRAPVEASA